MAGGPKTSDDPGAELLAELERRLADMRARRDELTKAIEVAEQAAARLRGDLDLPRVIVETSVSTKRPEVGYRRDMPVTPQEHQAAIARARQSHSQHPFVAAVLDRGMSVSEWARQHRLVLQRVASWYSTKPPQRRIPRVWADRIEKELGVPATLETWANGIRETEKE